YITVHKFQHINSSTMTTDPPTPAIFLQDACLQHQYIRSRDLSAIVERPERLRAVTIGLSAAIARLESIAPKPQSDTHEQNQDPDDLAAAMRRMNLVLSAPMSSVVSIVQSTASLDILNHPAVKYVHGDLEGDVYLAKLKTWARDSVEEIQKGGSEIPEGLSQGDLYLCPQSIDAIQGALGTVCEAVDRVMTSTRDATGSGSQPPVYRAFVAIRPPGHHCGEDTPSGFCFVNNVAVGAAHAHLQHGINRVVIFDIDLHHGNGTQSIAWQINEETYRQTLEVEAGAPTPPKPGLQVYYGSVHDILSYPCEDGKPDLVQAASVSIHGAHGQHIENVHLRPYESQEHFWGTLYDAQYGQLLRKAEEFLETTGGTSASDDVLILLTRSCGMDASEHEHASMSRHGRKVPAGLYKRFAQDVCTLSERYACGRVVSVLEGGYSDRALVSGAMAHLVGLALGGPGEGKAEDEWWSVENLVKLEKATKKRRGGRVSTGNSGGDSEPWLDRTLEIFQSLDSTAKLKSSASSRGTPVPPPSMTLRERKGKTQAGTPTGGKDKDKNQVKVKAEPLSSSNSTSSEGDSGGVGGGGGKKLPRVILRLGPDPSGVSSSS
ncbi:Histone deacetylase HOS3, partial [Hypsizygus marmoreus]